MRWKQYSTALTAIVTLRTADLCITAYYTPDLASEWNPLVSIFGASWGTLIFSQLLILLFTAGVMFFYFNREPAEIEPKGMRLNDFMRAYFTGSAAHGSRSRASADLKSFLLIPQKTEESRRLMKLRIQRHLIFNGWLFMSAVILISLFAVVHNLLLISGNTLYGEFVAVWYQLYFPAVFITGIFICALWFAHAEYRSYRRCS